MTGPHTVQTGTDWLLNQRNNHAAPCTTNRFHVFTALGVYELKRRAHTPVNDKSVSADACASNTPLNTNAAMLENIGLAYAQPNPAANAGIP